MSKMKSIRISQQSANAPQVRVEVSASLSTAQRKFNRLSEQVAKKKQLLNAWQESLTTYQEVHAGQLRPLQREYLDYQKQLMFLLDQHYADKLFTRRQKERIAELIINLSAQLYQETADEACKQVFNRYSETSYDDEMAAADANLEQVMKAMLEEELGIPFPEDACFSSVEELMDFVAEQTGDGDRRTEEHLQQAARQAKVSKKQQQRQEQKRQEEQLAQKSLQAVYRQLIASLHPDREPDEHRREQKTELMKQVTVAYERGDLMCLLELQLSLAQLDQARVNHLGDERLERFSRVLKKQAEQLQQQIDEIAANFRAELVPNSRTRLGPKQVLSALKNEIRTLEMDIADARIRLRTLRDPIVLKQQLKYF